MIFAIIIFILTYVLIIFEKFDRTVVALTGAVLMIVSGIITQHDAFMEIDYNTIVLLISMMVIVDITAKSGVFEYLAIKTCKFAKGEPIRIMIFLALLTGALSSVLDNVTTILLTLPVTMTIAKDLRQNPIPFIIAEVFASNVGGTATLIGDPPNIILGSKVGFSFMDFIKNNTPVVVPLLFLTTYMIAMIYRKKLVASTEAKQKVLALDEKKAIRDKSLMIKSLIVLGLTVLFFLLHGVLHLESATVAMGGAIVILFISGLKFEKILHGVEWKTIFFFAGLFILVGGLKASGAIEQMAKSVLDFTKGDLVLTTMAILWVSAIASAFLDNIPFVATMIPLIKNLGEISGINLTPLWWALSLGACLGGNGTIVGASANVIAVGIAEEHGHKITFKKYFKIAFPLMILTILICTAYLYIFYL
jgi:Na+/H+ antiporter NhaD/arsenite permease-like protein